MSAMESFQKRVTDDFNFSTEVSPLLLVVDSLLRSIEVSKGALTKVYMGAPGKFSVIAQDALEDLNREVVTAYKRYLTLCGEKNENS